MGSLWGVSTRELAGPVVWPQSFCANDRIGAVGRGGVPHRRAGEAPGEVPVKLEQRRVPSVAIVRYDKERGSMAYVISHLFAGGTSAQYHKTLEAVHTGGVLPPGQSYHAAGPTDDGWLVVAVWDSKESYDNFVSATLMPALQSMEGGLPGPPHEHGAEVANQITR